MNRPTVLVLRAGPALESARLQNEMDMFIQAGFDASVFCWDRKREYPPFVKHASESGDYRIQHCHVPGSYGARALLWQIPIWWAAELLYLLRNTPNHIHAVDFDTVIPALLAKWLKGVPVVFDIYDFFVAKTRAMPRALKPIVRWAERFCARRVNAVVIVDESRAYLLGEPKPKRLVIAENCSPDLVDPSWRKPERSEFVIFYAGNIARFRGLRKLVEVTARLDNVKVVIAGRINDERYWTLFEAAPHVEYVGVIGRKEVVRRTYDADAVYSYYDPALEINRTANSTKMFEAFMCSTPVLANREPPAARVIAEECCGSCLPYDDDAGLRRVIAEWRDNRARAKKLGEHGRRLFESRFNWGEVSERILDVYRAEGVLP